MRHNYMRAIDLLPLFMVSDEDFNPFESVYSCRKKLEKTKEADRVGLREFVKLLLSEGFKDIKLYDDFFFSFTIEQNSKEFDRLKIAEGLDRALNIELKSRTVDVERMRKQLIQNKYYLSSTCKDVQLYSIDLEKKIIYKLGEDDELNESDVVSLVNDIKKIDKAIKERIEDILSASHFLISPISSPDRFLKEFYCLNSKQEEIKNQIIWAIESRTEDSNLIGVTGSPGTGKSLLLYDIAREVGKNNQVLVIHCAIMSPVHERLRIKNVDIVPVKRIGEATEFNKYDLVLVDETHRIYKNDYEIICRETAKNNIMCVMFYDEGQTLAYDEISRNISQRIKNESGSVYILPKKIRANLELTAFITWFFDLRKWNPNFEYDCVEILYAPNSACANSIKNYYVESKKYRFINFTSSIFNETPFDVYCNGEYVSTHRAIGREFSKVVCVIDNNFYYDEDGKLCALGHVTHNYLYDKMLYQNLTRARDRICIIVMGNKDLFSRIISMLSKKYKNGDVIEPG